MSQNKSTFLKEKYDQIIGTNLDSYNSPNEIPKELHDKCAEFYNILTQEISRISFKESELTMEGVREHIKQKNYETLGKPEIKEGYFLDFLEHYKMDSSPGEKNEITHEEFEQLKIDAKSLGFTLSISDKNNISISTEGYSKSYTKLTLSSDIPELQNLKTPEKSQKHHQKENKKIKDHPLQKTKATTSQPAEGVMAIYQLRLTVKLQKEQ